MAETLPKAAKVTKPQVEESLWTYYPQRSEPVTVAFAEEMEIGRQWKGILIV